MAGVAEQINKVRAHLPAHVTLVCVSKFQPIEAIREAYAAGERHFGESRVQELKQKVAALPADIRWHFIGHLQTNKVRDLLKLRPYLIQSVDSEHLLQAINEEAAKQGIVQDVLLEVHVAREQTKTGFSPDQLPTTNHQLSNVRICGLMAMATNTEDEAEIRRCFETAHSLLSTLNFKPSTLSMGMSDDYPIAIECGSTMVRIGSTIFGARDYSRKLKAVFFDQDGVLFNSMPYHAQSWELAMNENGLPFTKNQTYRNEGRTGASVINEAYRLIHGVDAPQEVVEAVYAAKSAHFIRLTGGQLPERIPGIQDVLHFLHEHGVQCWVVTGSGQRNLISSLNDTFDHVFTGIICAYDVTHGKPDPEPYLKAWERSGFAKNECMVVENAPLGVRAGKAAGLYTVAVNTGILSDADLAAEGADIVLPDMKALLQHLTAILSV
jgi:pyridoxal phosphate enzyme (YggS family)